MNKQNTFNDFRFEGLDYKEASNKYLTMKRYEIRKEHVRINTIYDPILLRYDFNIIHESGEIIETLSEEELKLNEDEVELQSLVIIDGIKLAMLQVRKMLRRNDIKLLTYEEIYELYRTPFEVYSVYDRSRGEYIGYLEDFK